MSKTIVVVPIGQGSVRGTRIKLTDAEGEVRRVARLEIKETKNDQDILNCVDIEIPDGDAKREQLAQALEKMARMTRNAPKTGDDEEEQEGA